METVPSAVESIRYKMPTYDYEGAMLCAFASQKQYMSLYVEPRILDGYRTALQHLNVGKSCIRFKSIDQLPLNLVRTVLEETVQDLDAGRAEQGKK